LNVPATGCHPDDIDLLCYVRTFSELRALPGRMNYAQVFRLWKGWSGFISKRLLP